MHKIIRIVVESRGSTEARQEAENFLDSFVESEKSSADYYKLLEESEYKYPDYAETTVQRVDSPGGLEEVERAFENTREKLLDKIEIVREGFEEMTDEQILEDIGFRDSASMLSDTIWYHQLIYVYPEGSHTYVTRKQQFEDLLGDSDSLWVVNFDLHY